MRNLKLGTRNGSLLSGLGLCGLLAFAIANSAGAATSLDWRFYDFFNVPPGEWWDARLQNYGEAPIGAECFAPAGKSRRFATPPLCP